MNAEDNIDSIFSDKLKDKVTIPVNVKWNKDKGWNELKEALPNRNHMHFPWMKITVAAAIMGICFIGGLYFQKLVSIKNPIISESDLSVKEIDLQGGHHCTLAPFSKIQYVYSAELHGSDTLYVDGEAFINSAANKDLVVLAKNSLTKCRNAKFNIRAMLEEQSTIVTNVTGSVSVMCADNHLPSLQVLPNEQYTLLDNGIIAFKAVNNDPNFLAWKTGTLTFNNVPLENVVAAMENYYGVGIRIDKEEIKYCRITSDFKNISVKEALHNIEKSLNVKVNKKGLIYILSGKGC